MERDRRLTGTMRGQIANPEAPPGFELSNGWKVRAVIPAIGQKSVLRRLRLICGALDGKTNLLSRAPCGDKIKVGRNNVHIINTGQASQNWNSEGQKTKVGRMIYKYSQSAKMAELRIYWETFRAF